MKYASAGAAFPIVTAARGSPRFLPCLPRGRRAIGMPAKWSLAAMPTSSPLKTRLVTRRHRTLQEEVTTFGTGSARAAAAYGDRMMVMIAAMMASQNASGRAMGNMANPTLSRHPNSAGSRDDDGSVQKNPLESTRRCARH
jgi:hypothetical protein